MYDTQNSTDLRHPLNPLNTGELRGGGGGGGGMINLGPLIAWGLIILVVLVVLVLVFFAIWAAIAVFIDWWFVWCGLPLAGLVVAQQKGNDSGVVKIAIGAFSLVTLVMILAGVTGQSVVWSGTGFTRGPELWIPPWDEDFAANDSEEDSSEIEESQDATNSGTASQPQSEVVARLESVATAAPSSTSVNVVANPTSSPDLQNSQAAPIPTAASTVAPSPTSTQIPATATPTPPALFDKILWERDSPADESKTGLYVMDNDGSNQVRVLGDVNVNVLGPSLSPDASQIVFYGSYGCLYKTRTKDRVLSYDPNVRYCETAIFVIGTDGSNPKRLTGKERPFASGAANAVWSPKETKIAFVSDGSRDIWIMNSDGSNPTNLTNTDWKDRSPAWSPDGTQIVFTSEKDETGHLYVMNVDGSGLSEVTQK